MKPHEFWIDLDIREILPEEVTAGGLDFLSALHAVIHVREVLPIDWERVWKKMDEADINGDLCSDQSVPEKIQELVEKAIRGELE